MGAFNISIIVPIYNEAAQVDRLANRLRLLKDDWVKEIIIVDGGSTDGCTELLKKEFTVLQGPKGRAAQMNFGAQQASGSWLLFLHADTHLDSHHIKHAMGEGALYQWGRFNVRLSGQHLMFRVIEWFINWRSRITSVATGDQCLFIRKKLFSEISGFANIPLMEDVEICKRMRKRHKPKNILTPVTTSSRRWHHGGIFKTVFLMWKIRFLYWRGVSPEKLLVLYKSN